MAVRGAAASGDTGAPVRFTVLDSWRGIAAVMVVLFHAQVPSHIREFELVRAGESFVDFFFVLSGFVIAHAYGRRIATGAGLGRFLVERLGRIDPLHLVMLGLFVLFETVKALVPALGSAGDPAFSGSNGFAALVDNLLLAQAWGLGGTLSWNTPSWSISAEWLAYGAFGAAALLAGRRLWIAALVGAAACALVLAGLAPAGMESTHDFGAVRALYGFCIGVVLHRAAIGGILQAKAAGPGSRSDRLAWTVAELAAVGCIASFVTGSHGNALAYAAPLVFAFAINVFAHEAGHLSAILKRGPFVAVGLLSYSIYMIHMFVLLRLLNGARLADVVFGTAMLRPLDDNPAHGPGIWLGGKLAGDALMVGVVLLVVGLSAVTWRFVERPGQRAFRRLAQRAFGEAALPNGQGAAAGA
jgi:peptidoglycan/LPS O-acetylase OafA/YrhL